MSEDGDITRDTATLIKVAILELSGSETSTVEIFREDLLREQPSAVPMEWFEQYVRAIRIAQTAAHTIAQDALTSTGGDVSAAIALIDARFGQ